MVIRALDREGRRSETARYVVPVQYSWDNGWELTGDLPVDVRTSQEEVVAVARLTVEEYGVGASVEDAVLDLLTSLTDYYQSLEARGRESRAAGGQGPGDTSRDGPPQVQRLAWTSGTCRGP